VADHLEIEQKFDVDDGFVRPDFGGLAGVRAAEPVTFHLAATYFDTTDQRLAANKITLRRRTGGTDQGWHLKLPAGLDTRRELQAPLGEPLGEQGEDTVPAQFAARVAAVTEGLPLTPIAQLDTERTVVTLAGPDGTVVAEIADDVVTARRLGSSAPEAARVPLRWREIEVEVPVAAPDLQRAAAGLLRAAGARPGGHGSKLARVLSETAD
jgi:inorganic triphosphatase YgiF